MIVYNVFYYPLSKSSPEYMDCFSTRELARKYINLGTNPDDYMIDEYEVDSAVNKE